MTAAALSLPQRIKAFCTPYHFFVAAVLAGITALFFVVVLLMVLVVTNFNILDWME